MEAVCVEMDVGSKVTAVVARGQSSEVVERLTFRTSRESFEESVTKYGEDVRVMFEEGELTGWAYRTLLSHARGVIVCDHKRNDVAPFLLTP